LSNCIARHQRAKVPDDLVDQVMPFLHNTEEYFDDNATMLIQMDLHHWNLMVKPEQQGYRSSGILDFSDSIIGAAVSGPAV
jgi:aminoglycoside/choline kinase family phosphotransferase